MRAASPIRRSAAWMPAAALAVSSAAWCQSLPATAPTQSAPAAPVYATQSAASPSRPAQTPAQTPAQMPAQRAHVDFSGGRLAVSADNSSLNQILREISRVTGMKITGGVNDERVFGNYGPADASVVLNALLDGTGSNMMLISDDHHQPSELVLTPRNGGPSPPSPSAAVNDRDEDDLPPQRAHGFPQQTAPSPQAPVLPQETAAPPAAAPAASPDSQPQSPNGVKTPQQIYEELMKRKQTQSAPTSPTPQL